MLEGWLSIRTGADLQEEDALGGVGRQPVRQHAAGGAAAHNDEVVLPARRVLIWLWEAA